MSCPEGYVPCAKGCGGCAPADPGYHQDCDPATFGSPDAVKRSPPARDDGTMRDVVHDPTASGVK